MRGLDEGETYVVTRHGQPVGELTPMRGLRFVPASTVTAAFGGAPPIDAGAFRADLDSIVDQDIDPRA